MSQIQESHSSQLHTQPPNCIPPSSIRDPPQGPTSPKLLDRVTSQLHACLPSSPPRLETDSLGPVTLAATALKYQPAHAPHAAQPNNALYQTLPWPRNPETDLQESPLGHSSTFAQPIPAKNPNHAPLPTQTCRLHLRGGSSHASATAADAAPPPAPADPSRNGRGGRRLKDDERAPALLWWLAGGRSYPPPTGKQLRQGKQKRREIEVRRAQRRKAVGEGKGGGGFFGKLFGGGKKKGGGGGDGGGGAASRTGSSHRESASGTA